METQQPRIGVEAGREGGDDSPRSAVLFKTLYAELHRLAQSQLRRVGGVSLSATSLLHEAYLDLSARDPGRYPDRAHFMSYAARAMRGIVIDYARNRHALKRGGAFHLTTLDTQTAEEVADDSELSEIGDALDALARVEPVLAELVDLKYFAGLPIAEIAALRGVSDRTVERDWLKARLYLKRVLGDTAADDGR
jgi:RNA polymerase sigma factor (TIGR02999 family)